MSYYIYLSYVKEMAIKYDRNVALKLYGIYQSCIPDTDFCSFSHESLMKKQNRDSFYLCIKLNCINGINSECQIEKFSLHILCSFDFHLRSSIITFLYCYERTKTLSGRKKGEMMIGKKKVKFI